MQLANNKSGEFSLVSQFPPSFNPIEAASPLTHTRQPPLYFPKYTGGVQTESCFQWNHDRRGVLSPPSCSPPPLFPLARTRGERFHRWEICPALEGSLSLSLSLSALFYDRCQARRTTRERSCAEVAKNSDVERAAADEEAARVITFPVITRCRLAIYFPPPPLSYPLVHAPPLYSPSGFTYSSLVVFGSTFPSRFASSVENISFFFFFFYSLVFLDISDFFSFD